MIIKNEKPPEWIMTGCLSQFRVNVERTFWAYGDVIYNPGGITIREDILAHEEQHGRQQEAYMHPMNGEDNGLHMCCEQHPSEWFTHTLADGTDCAGPGMRCIGGKDAWWTRYLAEPRFRLEQEAEAYAVQYKWILKHLADRNKRARWLHEYATQLSGPLYQVAVTHQQAKQMIEILAGTRMLPKAQRPPEFKPV